MTYSVAGRVQAGPMFAAAAVLFAFVLSALAPADGRASFPGANGKISFWSSFPPAGAWQVGPSGGKVKRLVRGRAEEPDTAPDGRTVAYERRTGEAESAIFILRGRESRQLTTAPGYEHSPSFSGPRGRRVVYAATGDAGIWVAAVDGSRNVQVTDPLAAGRHVRDYHPDFSPDGRWIAFMRADPDKRAYESIFLTRPDGTDTHRIKRGADWASFSPNGRTLAYVSDKERAGLMTRKGKHIRWLTPRSSVVADVAFSPDGRRIVYTDQSGEHGGIWTTSLRGRRTRRVVKTCEGCRFGVPLGLDWAVKPR